MAGRDIVGDLDGRGVGSEFRALNSTGSHESRNTDTDTDTRENGCV